MVVTAIHKSTNRTVKFMKKIRRIFEPHDIYFDTKETYLNINGVDVEAFPAFHVDSLRGLDPAAIISDESDYYTPGEQLAARTVIERYVGRSDNYIVWISTPNSPGGLMDTLLKEEPSIYTKLMLPYQVGLDSGMFTPKQIERAKLTYGFEREYNLRFIGKQGNSFTYEQIEQCQSFAYNPDYINMDSDCVMGIDTGWGSSATGICVVQANNNRFEVLFAEEYTKAVVFRRVID